MIHDSKPAKQIVIGMIITLTEGPDDFRVCPRCSTRGIAEALRQILDNAVETDKERSGSLGAELRAEVMHILDGDRPMLVEGSETPQ